MNSSNQPSRPSLLESPDNAVLVAHGLTKYFDHQPALLDLDLAVAAGACYLLVGPNGAGKTTLLRLVLDLLRADRGTVEVFGLAATRDGAALRARIGYLPETHDFGYRELTVDRLLAHHACYFPSWDSAYAARLCAALEVPSDGCYGTLSKGMARRVQFVQALAHRPALLLLDEPTDGLDLIVRDTVLSVLAEHLASSETTVLLSTHRVHEVEGLGDWLGVLRDGRLTAQVRRATLEEALWRYRAEVPVHWSGVPDLEEHVLERTETGRELDWVVWGEPETVRARLQATGAQVRTCAPLQLEAAARALLARRLS
jgi:ABC-2 type transport system ATP-binding protein